MFLVTFVLSWKLLALAVSVAIGQSCSFVRTSIRTVALTWMNSGFVHCTCATLMSTLFCGFVMLVCVYCCEQLALRKLAQVPVDQLSDEDVVRQKVLLK